MPVGQRFETYRTEERLLRLDQEDRLREAGIVEAAAEVHARLDREDLEGSDIKSQCKQRDVVDDLDEVGR